MAQTTGIAWNARATAVSVPFVGCESSGQIEVLEAGVAILVIDGANPIDSPPTLVLLPVRVPPHLAQLTPVIVHYVERDVPGAARNQTF